MALTKTVICNLALSEIGNYRNQLTDFDTDTNSVAVQCQLHYPRAVEELVRMHTWNCAQFRTQLTTSAYTGHGWDYTATIPTGSLRVIALATSSTSTRLLVPNSEWVVENGNIRTNHEDPYILYMKEPEPANMDSLFSQALYTLLASKLAVPVMGDGGYDVKRALLDEFLNMIMPEARRVDGFEENLDDQIYSDYLSATFDSTSGANSWPPFASGIDYGTFSW